MHLSLFHEVKFTFYLWSQRLIDEVFWTFRREEDAWEGAGGGRGSMWGPAPTHLPLRKKSERQLCLPPLRSLSSLLMLTFAQPGLPLELGGLAPSQAARVYKWSHGKSWKLTINRIRGELWKTTSSFRHMANNWHGRLWKRFGDPLQWILLPADNVLKAWPLGTTWIQTTGSVYGV